MSAKPDTKQATIGEAIDGTPTSADSSAHATVTNPAAALAPPAPVDIETIRKRDIAVGRFGIEIRDLETLARFATMVFKSGLCPAGLDSPEKAAIAIEMGMELGQSPLWGLQNIAVINGRPGVYGDGLQGLVLASPKCEYARAWVEGDGESMKAISVVKRRGLPESVYEFTVNDAKKADLWSKGGNWTKYPKRMLRFRAHNFNLRDNFADLTKGVKTIEELQDYSDAIDVEFEMPKRASETAAAAAPATASATSEIDGKPVHMIASVTKTASGTDDGGKPFNVWSVKTRSGLLCETRSDGIAAQAKKHLANDAPVRLELTDANEGLPQISSLTAL